MGIGIRALRCAMGVIFSFVVDALMICMTRRKVRRGKGDSCDLNG